MALIATMTTVETDPKFTGITAMLTGALRPEGNHVEPTIGQIWPR